MSIEQFHRFPRHPDWKHEYWDGALQLSYRPKPIELVREVAPPVRPWRDHTVRLIGDVPRAFLAETWSREEPYRVVPAAEGWLHAELDRSARRLVGPRGAVVEEEGAVIGAVLVERPFRDVDDPVLTWLAVRSGFRCDGVATSLLAAILDALRAGGVARLASGASAANRASVAWHWRHGFRPLPNPTAPYGVHARCR